MHGWSTISLRPLRIGHNSRSLLSWHIDPYCPQMNLNWSTFTTFSTDILSNESLHFSEHLPNSPLFEAVYPLFVKYQVQLVITGHSHVYERVFYDNTTTIVNNTYTNVHSPVIVVQGTGGAYYDDKWIAPQPWWSKSRVIKYGYARVTVSTDKMQRCLYYEYLLEHDRSTYDQFSIVI